MKKKIIYILVYNEWDGGGGEISENIISSLSMETIAAYKKDLEDKSVVVQKALITMEDEKNNKLKPLWKELHPIIQSLRQSNAIKMDPDVRSKAVAERTRLTLITGEIHSEYYKKKDDLLNDLDMEYYIDDPGTSNFIIEELEVI